MCKIKERQELRNKKRKIKAFLRSQLEHFLKNLLKFSEQLFLSVVLNDLINTIIKVISSHWSLSIPPENIRKPQAFWYFQGEWRVTKCMKWIKILKDVKSGNCIQKQLFTSVLKNSYAVYFRLFLDKGPCGFTFWKIVVDHSRNTYAKFSKKLTFLTSWYVLIHVSGDKKF